MNRPFAPAHRLPSRALAAAALVLFAAGIAAPAHAGLGDLVKKAKDKAAQAAAQKAGQKAAASAGLPTDAAGGTVEFNDVILELTDARLDQFLAGMKAGSGGAGRAALVAKKDKLIQQEDALRTKYSNAIDAAREKHDAAERCWEESIGSKKDARDEAMRQKLMSDPAMRDKMMDYAKRMGEAQANGDTATVSRLTREMYALTGPTHADTVTARAECGPVPPPHPAAAQIEALQQQAAATDEQIREQDQQSAAARAKASGMTQEQFAMALERVQMYLDATKAKQTPRGFTAGEQAALASHQEALAAALE